MLRVVVTRITLVYAEKVKFISFTFPQPNRTVPHFKTGTPRPV